jgi:hypothetical protein
VATKLASPEFRKRFCKLITRGRYPFTLAEDENLRPVLEEFRPEFIIPSAKTVRHDAMEMYAEEADRVRDQLRNAGSKISLTLDCWTSPHTRGYLGVTAHYIDASWVLHSLVLDFAHLPSLHTGRDLCNTFVDVCGRFGILGNILGITTDNAANNDTLLDCFKEACRKRGVAFDKEQQHMRCMAHVANLAVQAFLRELKAEAPDGDFGPDDDVALVAGATSEGWFGCCLPQPSAGSTLQC